MPSIPAKSIPLDSTGSLPVGIYARASTLNQAGGHFDSCDSQVVMCRDFLRKHATTKRWHEVVVMTDSPTGNGG